MTAYNDLAASKISVDAPITEEVLTAIRDNPIAITEGSSGAPKVVRDAYADDGVTAGNYSILPLYEYLSTEERLPYFRHYNTSSVGQGSSNDSYPLQIGITGVYRFRFRAYKESPDGEIFASVKVNNSVVSETGVKGTVGFTGIKTSDHFLNQGDLIELSIHAKKGGISTLAPVRVQLFIGVSEKSAIARGMAVAQSINSGDFTSVAG